MMKLEIYPLLSLKQRLAKLLDTAIELLVRIGDFLVYKHITLSEGVLFGLAMFRAVWYLFFGVENANYSYYFRDSVWIVVFFLGSGLHLIGFFIKKCSLRVAAAYVYAAIWGFLTVLAAYSGTNAPAVPTLGIFALFSFIMIVRLSRENAKKEC